MSWLPLKIKKEEYDKQEAELRANWGNVAFVDESKIEDVKSDVPSDIQQWMKETDKALKVKKK